mgnify:CR=1 FL=1
MVDCGEEPSACLVLSVDIVCEVVLAFSSVVGWVVGDAVTDWSVAIGRVVASSAGVEVVSTSVSVVEMSGCVVVSDVGCSDFFSVVSNG